MNAVMTPWPVIYLPKKESTMTTLAKRKAIVPAWHRPELIRITIDDLRIARNKLRECGCSNAADYVARALKSVEGALRHASRRDMMEKS